MHDIEQSVRFYRDVLGLEVISPPDLPGVFLQVGEPGDALPRQIVLAPRPRTSTSCGMWRSRSGARGSSPRIRATERRKAAWCILPQRRP